MLAQGTGGVSCFVLQFAAAFGATVIATSSSDAKLEQAKAMGATYTINYRTHENWGDEVLRLTNGRGVDRIVEVAGASTIEQSLLATKRGGVVALVGFLSESKKTGMLISPPFSLPLSANKVSGRSYRHHYSQRADVVRCPHVHDGDDGEGLSVH